MSRAVAVVLPAYCGVERDEQQARAAFRLQLLKGGRDRRLAIPHCIINGDQCACVAEEAAQQPGLPLGVDFQWRAFRCPDACVLLSRFLLREN